MTADARQVDRLRETAESRLHADRPPYTRLVPVGAHVLIELLDAAEAHAALVKAVEGLLSEWEVDGLGTDRFCAAELRRTILAATDTAADGAR